MPRHKRELSGRGEAWSWLLNNGPHGPSFEWGQSPRSPRDYRSLELLRSIVEERAAADASFPAHARAAALGLLAEDEPELLRRAIQVLCVVGAEEDLPSIAKLLTHPDAAVTKDARACLFERGVRA